MARRLGIGESRGVMESQVLSCAVCRLEVCTVLSSAVAVYLEVPSLQMEMPSGPRAGSGMVAGQKVELLPR